MPDRAHIDPEMCQGTGTCADLEPAHFHITSHRQAEWIENDDLVTRRRLIEVALACPQAAISIRDGTGNIVYEG